MNDFAKNKIRWKHQVYKTYTKSSRKDSDYVKFQQARIVSEVISRRKEEYQNHITLKLNNLMKAVKASKFNFFFFFFCISMYILR